MTYGRILMAGCVAGLSLGASAVSRYSWKNPTEGDLADKSQWSGGFVPTIAEVATNTPTALFQWTSAYEEPIRITMSEDLTMGTFQISEVAKGQLDAEKWYDVTFDLGAARTLTLFGTDQSSMFKMGGDAGGYLRVRLASGTIQPANDAKHKTFRLMSATESPLEFFVDGPSSRLYFTGMEWSSCNSLFCVTNGGFVSGPLRLGGNRTRLTTNQVLRVAGTGSIWDNADMGANGFTSANVSENYPTNEAMIHVTDGGVVTNLQGKIVDTGSNVRFVVDGGSVHLMAGTSKVANFAETGTPSNNSVEILNNGYMGAEGAVFKFSNAGTGNRVAITDGGRYAVQTLYFGTDNANSDNEFLVGSGGRATIASLLQFCTKNGGKGVQQLASNNVITVSGEGARLVLAATNTLLSVGGLNNGLLVTDQGVVENHGVGDSRGIWINSDGWVKVEKQGAISNGTIRVGYGTATNALLSVCDQGLFACTNNLTLGDGSQLIQTDDGYGGEFNNTIFVGDKGRIETRGLRIYGNGNKLVISNGLVTAVGAISTATSASTSNGIGTLFAFAGSNPRLVSESTGTSTIHRQAKLQFTVPAEGYVEPVMSFKKVSIENTTTLSVNVKACKAGGTFVLVDSDNAITFVDSANAGVKADTWISDVNTKLNANLTDERASVSLSEDGKQLLLTVKPAKGLVLIIK